MGATKTLLKQALMGNYLKCYFSLTKLDIIKILNLLKNKPDIAPITDKKSASSCAIS